MPPTANAGSSPAPYPFSVLAPTLTVALNGLGSTPGGGASSIAEWAWVLKKPAGSSAALTNANTATPTLTVDRPGTFIAWLRVKNDLGQWSAESNGFSAAWEAMPSSIVMIAVLTENAELRIPGVGERVTHAALEELWLAVDRSSALSDPLYVDDVYEKTNGHGIVLHSALEGTTGTFRALAVFNNSPPAGELFSVGVDSNPGLAAVSADEGNGGDRIAVYWPIWGAKLIAREIQAGETDGVEGGNLAINADGVMTLDPGEGYIQAKADFRTDAITPIANNSGVTIAKRGTSDYDVKFDKAEAAEVNSVLDANLKLQRFGTLGSNNSTVELKNGVVEVSGGVGGAWDLSTSYIKPRVDNSGLTVRGRGTHTADLYLDELRSDSGTVLTVNDVPVKSGRVDGIDVSRLGPATNTPDEVLTNSVTTVQTYTSKLTVTGGLQVNEVQEITAAVFVNGMADGGNVTVNVRVDGNPVLVGSFALPADTGFILRGDLHAKSSGLYRLYGSVVCTDDNSNTPMRAVDLGDVSTTYDITVSVQFGNPGGSNSATLELLSHRIRPAYVAP